MYCNYINSDRNSCSKVINILEKFVCMILLKCDKNLGRIFQECVTNSLQNSPVGILQMSSIEFHRYDSWQGRRKVRKIQGGTYIVMWWVLSVPLVEIGLTGLPKTWKGGDYQLNQNIKTYFDNIVRLQNCSEFRHICVVNFWTIL